jgi:hypothetical protein
MFGRQYKVMGRFYVMVGETFQGIVREPVFLETSADGKPLSTRPERLDGWYLGVPTGQRFQVSRPASGVQFFVGVVLALGSALLAAKA